MGETYQPQEDESKPKKGLKEFLLGSRTRDIAEEDLNDDVEEETEELPASDDLEDDIEEESDE